MDAEQVNELRDITNSFCDDLSGEQMRIVMGQMRKLIIMKEVGITNKHFLCPITSKVLSIKSGRKITTKKTVTKTHTTTSWYYLSRKAFNKILEHKK